MVIGTSAIIDTELDGAVGMNSGILIIHLYYGENIKRNFKILSYNFISNIIILKWMESHAGKFLANLQEEIYNFK